MIEIDSNFGDGIVAIRHTGSVTDREFADLAAAITECAPHCSLLLFLDWLGIEDWSFSAPEGDTLAVWRQAASVISCAAIVHDHRLNRQAAWLGAVLREQGISVRSWRKQQAAVAAIWLRTGAPRHPPNLFGRLSH